MKTLFLRITLFLAALLPMSAAESKTQFLVLGGGCFWCTEAAYELVPGVKSVVSGYAGGQVPKPTYEAVCTGETGHAEVIRIEYDPTATTLAALLDYFWVVHDPTTLNAQGADHGTQYRSAIFYANDAEKAAAQASIARANPTWGNRIVTTLEPLTTFYPAEDYHQDYFHKNPTAGYCRVVIKPKIDKLKKTLGATGK